jgi:NIMA (never in mitosis gene a)-related kinase
MSIKHFEIGKELGKGSYSCVYICKRKADGKRYALKQVKIAQLPTKDKENALNEVRILASLSHMIIGYKEAFYENESKTLNIVMEYANDGDLECKIKRATSKSLHFSEALIWEYLIQLLNGLKYLHSMKIVHRDIKSANIFIKDGILKLGDLNIAKIDKLGMLLTQTGTPYYASPEIWDGKPYNYKSDMWSVGVVLYEMCTLKPPFNSTSLEGLYKEISLGVYSPISKRYSRDLTKVIGMLLQLNPDNRPSCDKLLNSDIILRNKKVSLDDSISHELLDTIKFPSDIKELHSRLPSRRKYTEYI